MLLPGRDNQVQLPLSDDDIIIHESYAATCYIFFQLFHCFQYHQIYMSGLVWSVLLGKDNS